MKNPLSNLMYDWISLLSTKAAGINAYETYLKDAQAENAQECIDLLSVLRDHDVRMVEEIKAHVMALFIEEQKTAPAAETAERPQASMH